MKQLKRFLGIFLALTVVFGMLLLVGCGEAGEPGEDGEDGVGIEKAEIDAEGNLILYYTDDTEKGVNVGKVVGGDDLTAGQIENISASAGDAIKVTLVGGIELDFAILQEKELASEAFTAMKLTDGKTLRISMEDGTSVKKNLLGIKVDAAAQLIFRFDDETEYLVGKVIGDVSSGNGAVCAHEFSEWGVVEAATCASIGYETRTCSLCGYVEYKFIPAVGHSMGTGMVLEATEDGILMLYSCPECEVAKISSINFDEDIDSDGLTNGEEITAGSDISKVDTDGDGLSDYQEVKEYFTDPAEADTDGDGFSDSEEIAGITDNYGNTVYTYPSVADSDNDGLSDYEEVRIYFTYPLDSDSDDDGALDGAEVSMGLDPLIVSTNANGKFDVSVTIETEDIVKPGIEVELDMDQLNSLEITENDYFEEETLGYMGQAYDYKSDVELTSEAIIKFVFEQPTTAYMSSSTTEPQPTIYEYDTERNSITPLYTTVVDNTASASVTKFGTYILLDRTVLESDLVWIDNWGIDGTVYTELEAVFVIDDSGSMDSNDSYYQCLDVAKDVISGFGDKASVGIVKFSSGSTILTSGLVQCTTTGKETLNNILTTNNFYHSGLTYLYTAINDATTLFSTPSANDTVYRIMIVLSDGYPEGESLSQSYAISAAQSKDIEIYTVGLGSNESMFNQNLRPVASATGGTFQYAYDYNALGNLYDKIRQKIDMTVDSDEDGVPDYYEENMVSLDGVTTIVTDKFDEDTDDDELLDGEEVEVLYVYNFDQSQITFIGKVNSNPTEPDSDFDGVRDPYDAAPFDAAVA